VTFAFVFAPSSQYVIRSDVLAGAPARASAQTDNAMATGKRTT
jgi:hypothetical protein